MTSIRILAALLVSSALAVAQQQPQPQPPNSPLELPEFLVTGKENISIGASAKQQPQRPPLLTSAKLDTLNPTEKLPIPPLPARPLPQYTRTSAFLPGYLEASFGSYITPKIEAGYSFLVGGYRLDASADVEASSGWNGENTAYLTGGGRLLSTYVAPDKFIFFGGSTTEVDVAYRIRSYELFGAPSSPARSQSDVRAGVDVDGQYENTRYSAHASWRHIGMSTDGYRDVSDDLLRGALKVEQRWQHVDVGAMLDMNLQTFATQSYPFVEMGAYGRWVTSSVRLAAGAGLQWATSTRGVDRFGLAIGGTADVAFGDDLSLLVAVKSGMRTITFRDLVATNPYLDDSIDLDAAYDIVDVRGTLALHPSVRTTVNAGVRFRQTDREPVWVAGRAGMFTVAAMTVTRAEVMADARFVITPRDGVIGDVTFTSATVQGHSSQPYVPSIRASFDYERSWTAQLRTGVGMVYVGQRWADLANTVSLPGYADLRLRGSYEVTKGLDLFVRAENLLGSTVILWDGYRERGLFIHGGCMWRF